MIAQWAGRCATRGIQRTGPGRYVRCRARRDERADLDAATAQEQAAEEGPLEADLPRAPDGAGPPQPALGSGAAVRQLPREDRLGPRDPAAVRVRDPQGRRS